MKVQLIEFAVGMHVQCETKRGVKDNSQVFDLSN